MNPRPLLEMEMTVKHTTLLLMNRGDRITAQLNPPGRRIDGEGETLTAALEDLENSLKDEL